MLVGSFRDRTGPAADATADSCDTCGDHGHPHPEGARLVLAVFGGILVLNSYLARLLFPEAIDPFAADLSAVIGALILGIPILIAAVRDLVRGRIYMNELVALALIAAFASHDFRTAGAIAFFMLVTITIERRTARGAEASIESLIRLTPQRARRIVDGREQDVAALDLQIDDVFRVRPGENLPADGVIINGVSTINQASITGESLPADKSPDDQVFAGTQNLTGALDVRVTRVGTDTTLGKVRELIVAAEQTRTPVMRMIDQYVGYYTPTILMIAALVWFFSQDVTRVIAVLVMACPCALVIATPSAVIAAIAAAARLGILIKDVAHIELAARVRAVIFDKTGTLTQGKLEVARLKPAEGVELAELAHAAVSAESHSNHPAAQAMRHLAEEADLDWEEPSEFTEEAGRGVIATVAGDLVRVGRETWLRQCGLDTAAALADEAETEAPGMTRVFVARGNRVLGWIGLRDAIRDAAAPAVQQLKELGVTRCALFTGDNQAVADIVGTKIGLTEIRAGCLPHEKVDFVEEVRADGTLTAVVGDGVNDAPALAAGDIGIAMGSVGSDVAIQSASVALMNNDLRRIPFFVRLSRQARGVMTQNLSIGLFFIVGGLYLSATGYLPPVAAAVIHSVSSLVILFNSARLVRSGEELETIPPVT